MKIRISFPGQDVRIIDAPAGLINHYERLNYDPPFVERLMDATLWFRWNGERWDFNHLEDGHCTNPGPTPKHESHNHVWKGGKWRADHVYLVDGVVYHQQSN